eukprot:470001-Prorocentrum_minimum.AAC.1
MADAMSYNEFTTHAALQPPEVPEGDVSPNLPKLIGGFVATEGLQKGEQWLVFRNDGTTSAAAYANVRTSMTITNNMTSSYGFSYANNGKGALNTPETDNDK